jgi:abequosyltransferase
MKITIAIPSYNRPETLLRLLKSIDFVSSEIEIVICEDHSPKRSEIKQCVTDFKLTSEIELRYFENQINLGYDENLWELVRKSKGEFILFMGDDDVFLPGALEILFNFLLKNPDLGYVLKSHVIKMANGENVPFNYYNKNMFFEKGEATIVELFRKSVLISGFLIRREPLLDYYTDKLNGTLLIQLYFLSIQCNQYPSAYLSTPLTMQMEEGSIPYFGSSENEKGLYDPGKITIKNSLNFLNSYLNLLEYIDLTLHVNVKDKIVKDMSKYFYPSLSIQRHNGRKIFYGYYKELNKLGFNVSKYYHLYFIALYVLGEKSCDSMILTIKKRLKATPKL